MAKTPQKTDDRKDVQRVEIVPPATDGTATSATQALTPGQQAGLDPIDPARDEEQQGHKTEMTNVQTDHESDNALDGVSGTPTPGVTAAGAQGLTGVQQGQYPSDMSGRPPMELASNLQALLPKVREGLRNAQREDKQKNLRDEERGFRDATALGLSGADMRRIAEAFPERFETVTIPNGHFFPDTGTRYRLK